jgi:hypothetical protein
MEMRPEKALVSVFCAVALYYLGGGLIGILAGAGIGPLLAAALAVALFWVFCKALIGKGK